MAEHHFVKDYENYVDMLLANYPIDEAMSHAVGGAYEDTGRKEQAILEYAGLKGGHSLFDLGCGSGRLATTLANSGLGGNLRYKGADVVQKLLDYAASKCPPHFEFVRHTELSIPAADNTLDMVCVFSVFTHLQHTESYIYMEDAYRALSKGGTLVFSFLEFALDHHWPPFAKTVADQKAGVLVHMNTWIEKSVIKVWAQHLGFDVVEIVNGEDAPWDGEPLGQSTAILRKPT